MDIAVFISHRWWAANKPDTEDNMKYKILCRSLTRLVSSDPKLKASKGDIVVWMDFACIEQDDPVMLMQGVRSLIAWR